MNVTDYPLLISAEIIADSINPAGIRLTTMKIVCHRFVLAELNTHRAFSRNSASSRAIPVAKTLKRFDETWAVPISWPAEQRGMQGGAELTGQDLEDAQELFRDIHDYVSERLHEYLDSHEDQTTRLHKSVLNRLMEFGQWHEVIITATEWDNFFKLRCHPDAQPEIRAVAEQMKAVYDAGVPTKLKKGEWHLPLFGFDGDEIVVDPWERVQLSCARCARVSYLTHEGKRDLDADFDLFARLKENGHWSPFEHAAQAMSGKIGSGNFRGFKQARYYIETGEAPITPVTPKPRKKKSVKVSTNAGALNSTFQGNFFGPNTVAYGNSYNSLNYYQSQYLRNQYYTAQVINDPKDYFLSPRSADRRVIVVGLSMNAAQKFIYEMETERYRNGSFINMYGRYPRVDWHYYSNWSSIRGLKEFDVILMDGWETRADVREIQDELAEAQQRGQIKYFVKAP